MATSVPAQALDLLRQGSVARAEAMLVSHLQVEPEDGAARHVLGLARMEQGRLLDALREFDLALLSPAVTAGLHFNRALALSRLSRWQEAEASLARALELAPAMTEAWFHRGNALKQLGLEPQALASFEHSLALKPDLVPALTEIGGLRLRRGEAEASLSYFDRALALKPDHATACNERGVALHTLGRVKEALICFERAIAANPDFADAWNNLGNAQCDLRQLEAAQRSIERALAQAPDMVEAVNNYGMVLRDRGQLAQAREQFERALALRPGHPEALRRRAALNLLEGRFAEGWADYEAGNRLQRTRTGRETGLPFWEGQDLAGKSILLSEPSGLGDTIQFLRFVPRLIQIGARVSFTGSPSMFRLLSGFSPGLDLQAAPKAAQFDYQCWLMDLPHRLGLCCERDFQVAAPYLQAEVDVVSYWADRLDQNRLNVGITWQGNPARKMDSSRSIPLREFLPLAQVPGLRLVSLQKRFGLEQIAEARDLGIDLYLPEGLDEGPDAFIDSAALMQHLDLVISADSSSTHLAGALGRPAWLALGPVPDWRWMLGRNDSPWYASVRLFRQAAQGGWGPVFLDMARALAPMAAARGEAGPGQPDRRSR